MASSSLQAQFSGALTPVVDALRKRPAITQTAAAAGATALLITAYRDYRQFLALGKGGIPYNALGWLISVLVLRPLALSYSARLYVGDYPEFGASQIILDLPLRSGPRPVADGIVPHRQMTDNAAESMASPLSQMMLGYLDAPEYKGRLEVKKSHYELHNDALYVKDPSSDRRDLPQTARVAKGEVMHIHPNRSLHVYLHPADARVVIEKGWGERHRLSRTWPWWMDWRQDFLGLTNTWIMIYGARDEKEVDIARRITREGVRWMLGDRK